MKRLLLLACMALLLVPLGAGRLEASVVLNSTNFPDATFRAAVSQATNVAEGSTLTDAKIAELTTLDVSNMGITSLRGLGYLSGLVYLDISDNNTLTTGANINDLSSLRTLKASNCNLATLSAISSGSYAGLTLGSGDSNIIYLDLSHNTHLTTVNAGLSNLTKMETLLMTGCTALDYWGNAGLSMSSLKWLDVSGCTIMDRVFVPAATQLQHLNASGTRIVGFSSSSSSTQSSAGHIVFPVGLNTLTYLNLSNCSSFTSFRAIYEKYHVTSIDTLIFTNDDHLGWSTLGIEMQTGLRYLDVTNCALSTTGSDVVPHFGTLTHLETLLIGENPNLGYLRLPGAHSLHTLDVHGNTGLTIIALVDCSLPRNDLSINDTGCTALTGLKLNDNGYSSVSQAMTDATNWGLDNIRFLYLQRNSGFAGGDLTMDANDCGLLSGIDLSDNGFTSFSAPSLPSTLTALMLGNTPTLTRLEMHDNPGITRMAADTVMYDGSGLYLLGNSALTYMDISGTAERSNHFQHIGNNRSLSGVPIDTLKASYNKFYTFRNLSPVAGDISEHCHLSWNNDSNRTVSHYLMSHNITESGYEYNAHWHSSPAMPDSASLEDLTQLRYLDLSHCQLKDSVYLHKNTELRYLDVSHNRTIARYNTSQDKGKAYRDYPADGTAEKRTFPDYKKYLWLANPRIKYPGRQQAYDQEYYTMDYNDTTGLYILDLIDNSKLQYLDISYTGIEQTALTHCHVSLARYVWIQDLPNLKYFYADFNGMRSLGVSTKYGKKFQRGLASLERMSVMGMRGADVTTMYGSVNLHGDVNTKLHYVNFAYSDFDSIGCGAITVNPTTGAITNTVAAKLDTLIVTGNPIHYLNVQLNDSITYIDARECAFKFRGYDPETGHTEMIPGTLVETYIDNGGVLREHTIHMNGARTDGTYNGTETTPFSGMRAIRAHHRPKLTTVLLNKSNGLRDTYLHFDPELTLIAGFEDLRYENDIDSLNLVWVNDDYKLTALNLSQNDNLRYLHAYNDKALGDALDSDGMNLINNVRLKTAWVSNSRLQSFVNGAGEHLDTLLIWTNPQLAELNVTNNTGLKVLDLRNCRVRTLAMDYCDDLTYFDCSNDSIQGYYDPEVWFGFSLPRAVPVPVSINPDQDGKNSIADLSFSSKKLEVVKADKNDLFSLKGLTDNPGLNTLTYSYNHINGIDLRGCSGIINYDCTHNGRGVIDGEMSSWLAKGENGDTVYCSMYYLQLTQNAGDALTPGYDTFLGHKMGHDSIEADYSQAYYRQLSDDGFDPEKVINFTVNASGPYQGTRGDEGGSHSLRSSSVIYGPDTPPEPSSFYGKIAVIRKYDETRNYIEYTYRDGRPSNRDGDDEGTYSTYYLVWKAPGTPTDVEETLADDLGEPTVVVERYYDISGAEHSEPFPGVNIIVRQLSDGSTQTVKVIR